MAFEASSGNKSTGNASCEDYNRKELPSTSQGLEPSSVPKQDAEHKCKSCRKCVIVVTGASTTTTVSRPQIVYFRKPPFRPAPVVAAEKNRRILCIQCFCQAGKIPCEICCTKSNQCRTPCPCCNILFKRRFLNPHVSQMYKQICPRCTRPPGEGICDHCRKFAEKSAAALARCRPKRGRKPKPPVLKVKEAKDNEAKVDEAKDVKLHFESKEKKGTKLFIPNDLRLLDQSYVKDEYCLNCECRHGKEPCNTCINTPCYGKCECCVQFNRQLLTDLLEVFLNVPENYEHKEEQVKTRNTGVVMKRKITSSSKKGRLQRVKTVDCHACTSKTHVDHLYSMS